MQAKAYDSAEIKFLGEVMLNFRYKKHNFQHKFLVVDNDNVCLLGRDLCQKLNIKLSLPSKNIFSVKNVLHKYDDYLSDKFSSCVQKKVKFNIKEGVQPVFCKARTVPLRYRKLVSEELSRLEKAGIVSKVLTSEWGSPTVNVFKAGSNKVRICGDFSMTLNKHMIMARFPLPSIEEVSSKVGNAKYFSVIDLSNAFQQLPLEEESKKYTTICTSEGMYFYNFLPFGTCSSPGIFQSFSCEVLAGIENVLIYQDDLLLLNETSDQHSETLDKVLGALKNAGLKINRDKSQFFASEVKYLGHIFNESGVHMDPEKIRAIVEAPVPKNVKEVQSFIGLANYYNRFIKNFSNVFAPLYDLIKKNAVFKWGKEENKCFEIIKKLFSCKNLVLKSFDQNIETALEVDASSTGIGATLLQKHGKYWLPVMFASRTLNKSERNYSQIEREGLSVLFGCEKFKKYLLGTEFILRNDHLPLKKLFSSNNCIPQNCSARLIRWALRLSQFKFNFEYIKGIDNTNADFLSRLPLNESVDSHEPYELVFALNHFDKMPITLSDIIRETNNDENLLKLKSYIINGFPGKLDTELSEFSKVTSNLSISKDCILFENRVYIPKILRNDILKLFHENHPGISAMRQISRALIWYPCMDKDIVNFVKSCPHCQNNQVKPPQNNTLEWPKSTARFQRIHADHFFFEDKIFFIVIDTFSRYIECAMVPSVSSNCTIEVLREIFARNGLPGTLVTDNSTSFVSAEFQEFMDKNKIIHMTSPAWHPPSNGPAENSVRIIKQLLKKNTHGSMRTRLSQALFHHRTAPHSVTKIPPSVALNGRKYITLRDRINPLNVPNLSRKEVEKTITNFEIGENVLVLNSRPGPKWFRGIITEKLGRNIYNVKVFEFDSIWCRHANQLRSTNAIVDKGSIADNFDVDLPSPALPQIVPLAPTTNIAQNEPNAAAEVPDAVPDIPGIGPDAQLRRSTRERKPVDRLNL